MWILTKIWTIFIDSLQTILLVASVFLVLYIFIIRPYQVDGVSMFPNFKNGEYVLTNVIGLKYHALQLGDVIVFNAKAAGEPEKDYIKRVIGLPGDTVMVENGNVYLNGRQLDQSKFLAPTVQTYGGAFLKDGIPVTVPPNHYFVMGDNRPESSDSRQWGFVDRADVLGMSSIVVLPLSDFHTIHNPYTK